MAKAPVIEMRAEFVSMPRKHRAYWKLAMRIISRYEEIAGLELETQASPQTGVQGLVEQGRAA